MDDVTELEYLSDLFRFRLQTLCTKLIAKNAELKSQGMSAYDINMMATSDLIQDLAQAYAERRTIDCCVDFLAGVQPAHDNKVMGAVFRVFALGCVKRDLSFYINEKAIKPQAGANLLIAQNSLIKTMATNVDDLLKLLAVPDEVLYAPPAQDYVGYFSRPNFGEVVAAKL